MTVRSFEASFDCVQGIAISLYHSCRVSWLAGTVLEVRSISIPVGCVSVGTIL